MDLFVLATIGIVFLVLLGASLLVNKMPSGKTFEEVQKEKKQLDAQMKQQSRPAKQKGGNNNGGAKNKDKKGKKNGKPKAADEPVEESHVEFAEEPVFLSEDLPVVEPPTKQKNKKAAVTEASASTAVSSKKSKGKSQGILVNKGEPTVTKPVAEVKEENHFEEIHPKDDIEMLKAHKEEPSKGGKPQKNALNEARKEKKAKANKAQNNPSTKAGIVLPPEVAEIEGVEQILKANSQKLQGKSRSQDAVDSVRKPRAIRTDNSMSQLQKMLETTDEISVNVLIMLLAKAELSRSEIQVVIDYLLNKQSDSGAVIKSEWTEGKQDLVARLKKQLAERETQLQNEQEAAAAFQEKLKLLRLELNAEKTTNSNTAKMYILEMAQKEKEMEVLNAKVTTVSAEKTALLAQMQKMQVTLVQQKNAMGSQEEHQRQLQQLQEVNATMQRELEMYKNSVQAGKVDLRNLENELDSARKEILLLHQKAFEGQEQVTRDMQVLSAQVTELKVQAANYENVLADKKALIEQYEAEKGQTKGAEETLFRQLTDHKQSMALLQSEVTNYEKQVAEKKCALDKYEAEREQHKAAEEELQRQLDQQKEKVANYEKQIAEKKAALDKYEAEREQRCAAEEELQRQLEEQKQKVASFEKQAGEKRTALDQYEAEREQHRAAEEALQRQLEEQKQKNNDLRTTNWRLMEAVNAAEKSAANVHNNELKQKKDLEALVKTRVEDSERELRDKFTQMLTQISVFSNLKVDSSNGTNGDSNGIAHLDAWMQRVTGELKKKLDVYESLLSALKQQLQDKRERDVMGASAKNSNSSSNSSSAKFIGEQATTNGGAGEGAKNGNGTGVAT